MCRPAPSSSTTSRTAAPFTSTAQTRAPAAANAAATALPIPPPAPVTTTDLPSRPVPMLQLISSTPPCPTSAGPARDVVRCPSHRYWDRFRTLGRAAQSVKAATETFVAWPWRQLENPLDRSDPRQLSGAERLRRAPAPLSLQNRLGGRPGRLGRGGHAVCGSELRHAGAHRGPRTQPRRQGCRARRDAVAAEQGPGMVVRLRRGDPLVRRRRPRHPPLGPEGEGAPRRRAPHAPRGGGRTP